MLSSGAAPPPPIPKGHSVARKLLRRALAAALGILTAGVAGIVVASDAAAATPFKVLAFYNGTWDAAHIDFDAVAGDWFPRAGAI
jgi:hypothetical protein